MGIFRSLTWISRLPILLPLSHGNPDDWCNRTLILSHTLLPREGLVMGEATAIKTLGKGELFLLKGHGQRRLL